MRGVNKMINPIKLIKLKSAWALFSQNHPKFPKFLDSVHKNALEEGTIIEINVITLSGKTLSSNVKLNKSDAELFLELSELFKE